MAFVGVSIMVSFGMNDAVNQLKWFLGFDVLIKFYWFTRPNTILRGFFSLSPCVCVALTSIFISEIYNGSGSILVFLHVCHIIEIELCLGFTWWMKNSYYYGNKRTCSLFNFTPTIRQPSGSEANWREWNSTYKIRYCVIAHMLSALILKHYML